MKEIMELPVERGIQQLEWLFEEKLQEKIDFFGAHGLDVMDEKVMGTTIYRDFIQERKRQYKDQHAGPVRITEDEAQRINDFFNAEIAKVVEERRRRESHAKA